MLAGTALVSTLLLSSLLAPTPAAALVDCTGEPPGPAPISLNETDAINCVNTDDRTDQLNTDAIYLATTGGNAGDPHYIYLNNTGTLTSTGVSDGVRAYTTGDYADIGIVNDASVTAGAQGISASTLGLDSDIDIDTTGPIVAGGNGIIAYTGGNDSAIEIINVGNITADNNGISASTFGEASDINIDSTGIIDVAGAGINAYTQDAYSDIDIDNNGNINSSGGFGINAMAFGYNGDIDIDTAGNIDTAQTGINAYTQDGSSSIDIVNDGNVNSSTGLGINATTLGDYSDIDIDTIGNIDAAQTGINAYTAGRYGGIAIANDGNINSQTGFGIAATAHGYASAINIATAGNITAAQTGINAYTNGEYANIDIRNNGNIIANTGSGINATTQDADSNVFIGTRGNINAQINGIVASTAEDYSIIAIDHAGRIAASQAGIRADTGGDNGRISIDSAGRIVAGGVGIETQTFGDATTKYGSAGISIDNSADITAAGPAAIRAQTGGDASSQTSNTGVFIQNRGDLAASVEGIFAQANGEAVGERSFAGVDVRSSGDIFAPVTGIFAQANGNAVGELSAASVTVYNYGGIVTNTTGIFAQTNGDTSGPASSVRVLVANYGDIDTAGGTGIFAQVNGVANGNDSSAGVGVLNRGSINAANTGIFAHNNSAPGGFGTNVATTVQNWGGVTAGSNAIFALSQFSNAAVFNYGTVFGGDDTGVTITSPTQNLVFNTGTIGAASLHAIRAIGASAEIRNYGGVINGFITLTSEADVFRNYGGTFNARLDSNFGGDSDVFFNYGTVNTAQNGGAAEITRFLGLETFNNPGLVSLVDGGAGDRFFLSGDFVAGSGALAVDAHLGGPGSIADVMQVAGDTVGQTALIVNNTNPFGGAPNKQGITVVEVEGSANANNFQLQNGPIDAGFFVYDLFFEPGAGGALDPNIFVLRSGAPGSSAFILPQLITASQDIWHATAGTWFDRSADLRVLLNGGGPGMAAGGAYGAQPMRAAPPGDQAGYSSWGPSVVNTPAVWAKGSGTWLDRDGSASSSAFGQTYHFNLDRDLDVFQLQSGIDFGIKGLFGERDTLVFGLLGGYLAAGLDYDRLSAMFDYRGGEVGGYATYLNGGWFVDTLVKVDFLDVETIGAPGVPSSFDSTTWGFRTDTGYRFGGWRGGAFLEPLGTIEVIWADIDNFSGGGNSVAFDDDANVRGRLGLRAGLSQAIWQGITMEPFVIGSVWSNLSGDNKATLTSFGTPFAFTDDIPDVWGEGSLGVNFFAPGALTALYAKLDVTFGDDIEGFAGKGGMRISW